MSLISDTGFLIHSLRLSYLRDVSDEFGPRIISFAPSYLSNAYITASSMGDSERWPELNLQTSSPELSEDEDSRPAARLRPNQNALRVRRKRASLSKRFAVSPTQEDLKNFVSDNALAEDGLGNKSPAAPKTIISLSDHAAGNLDLAPASVQPEVHIQQATAQEEPPVAKVVMFVPKFKGAAEMEKRRRIRMAARRGAPPPVISIDSSSSSSDEPTPVAEDSSDSDFGGRANDEGVDEADEFDPDFINALTPGIASSGLSDAELSGGQSMSMSASNSPAPISSRRPGPRPLPAPGRDGTPSSASRKPVSGDKYPIRKPSNAIAPPRTSSLSTSSGTSGLAFPRKKVAAIKQQQSSLTALIRSSAQSSNPFSETYAAVSGRGEPPSINVSVFFPHAHKSSKAMELNIRKDSTIEEVVGFALFTYWEEGWLPKLDEGLQGEDDPKWATRVAAVGWILRIAEDDGEVDDDFPPPDRMGKIAKFHADAYAVLEATPSQLTQNQILESKIRAGTKKSDKSASSLALPLSAVGPGSTTGTSAVGSLPLSTSLGPGFSSGPPIFLRCRVADTADADAVHISTTIPVSAEMYMQEALELVCRKRKLPNPKDYALLVADMSILIPLDRTVASLQGKRDLVLIKRSMLEEMGANILKIAGRTTDPNASIFKRISEPEVQMSAALDYTAAYKKFLIYRKMPMLVARQERTLAIDGVYIHIMPSNKAKAVFESGKTWSYHIKSIISCQQSSKTSPTFRLILNRAGHNKRYDFDAESPKMAAEIVQILRAAMERTGTARNSRRSRHVG
ncbi:stress-activated map kinase interacting protein 1-domain-containing protein [Mycena floridula]|nr:stress-activated map kinase interacting protein 1-domain-containing protein [Mycena floridula]